MSIFISFYICLFFCANCWQWKRASRNCVWRMQLQATGSNPLSGSIICPSIRPSVRRSVRSSTGLSRFWYLYPFPVWGSSVAVHLLLTEPWHIHMHQYPHTGVQSTPLWSSQVFMSICLSFCSCLCLSVFMSGCPHRFLASICAARNCVQRMWMQDTGSNPLSGGIIFPYVC